MKITGIVAEYNPFHNGHRYQLERARAAGADYIVAVMSGCFTQRGEPAVFDHFARTRAALLGGVDIVLELPVPYAVSGAQQFARGAVALLDALGCIDALNFGSECGELPLLQETSRALSGPEADAQIRENLRGAVSYATARQLAVEQLAGVRCAAVLAKPNNTLAVEYLSALARLDSRIIPETVARAGVVHDAAEASGEFASASYLRSALCGAWEPFVPPRVLACCRDWPRADFALAERAVLFALRSLSPQEPLPDLTDEGEKNRLFRAVRSCTGLEQLYEQARSRRYPLARVRRIVLSAFLGIEPGLDKLPPPYARLLGFRRAAAPVLARIKECSRIPLMHSAAEACRFGGMAERFALLGAQAVDRYGLCTPEIRPAGLDYTGKMIVLEE